MIKKVSKKIVISKLVRSMWNLTNFILLASFYNFRKQKISDFLLFSGVMGKDQWHEMG